jgi:hypothetical protein
VRRLLFLFFSHGNECWDESPLFGPLEPLHFSVHGVSSMDVVHEPISISIVVVAANKRSEIESK